VKYSEVSLGGLMHVEEYLRLTEKPHREYRDGVVSLKSRPTKLHAIIQYMLLTLLTAQLRNQGALAKCEEYHAGASRSAG
jgi:Uma2 family endonuclease